MKIYNKIHLSGGDGELKVFSKGTTPLILDTSFGKIGFGICYDTMCFPELVRYYAKNGVNLYVSIFAMWAYLFDNNIRNSKSFLTRAIEYHVQSNGIYLANSNASGMQNKVKFLGCSCVVGPSTANELPVHYFCNSKLSITPNIFYTDIDLNKNLRMINYGNRFSSTPSFNMDLYKSWYN